MQYQSLDNIRETHNWNVKTFQQVLGHSELIVASSDGCWKS